MYQNQGITYFKVGSSGNGVLVFTAGSMTSNVAW